MFSIKLMAIFFVVWVIGMFLGATYEQQNTPTTWTGTASSQSLTNGGYGQISDVDFITNINNAVQSVSVFGTSISLPLPNPSYFKAVGGIMFLRFSFLVGTAWGQIFWFIVLMPISVMGVAGLVLLFLSVVRGNISWG